MGSKIKPCLNNTAYPLVNPLGHMDKKTFNQYQLEARKILIRSFFITGVIGIIYALISPPDGIIDPFFIAPLVIVGVFIYIISKSKLNAKYKILDVYRSNKINFSSKDHRHLNIGSNFNNSTNPTYPGTAAWTSRKHRNEL